MNEADPTRSANAIKLCPHLPGPPGRAGSPVSDDGRGLKQDVMEPRFQKVLGELVSATQVQRIQVVFAVLTVAAAATPSAGAELGAAY